ncbi:MAG TPA: AAA family ATPase, partial [Actinomycetes bacterium]
MLYGRQTERARISALLADASHGRGGVLVIRGHTGIGKSTLLLDAAQQGDGKFMVLRGTGVDSEVELAFAALHQLLRPVLDRLDRLPAPQASALRGAFGLVDRQPNRFHIELGALSLLAEAAKQQPVLGLVDDAQWLDRASADALVFVARRLRTEPVLLVAASDDGARRFSAPELPELVLGGLDPVAARQLLGDVTRQQDVAATVCDWLIEQTEGNPLALLELPAALTVEQLAGRVPLPVWLPLSARLQQALLVRVRRLPEATQALLLVAAAEDTGELTVILAAARNLGLGAEELEPAEREGLVQIVVSEPELPGVEHVRFLHPLIRSAIYEAAPFTARRA